MEQHVWYSPELDMLLVQVELTTGNEHFEYSWPLMCELIGRGVIMDPTQSYSWFLIGEL